MVRRSRNIEIPGPGQESVWDYPRPPRVEPVQDVIRVIFNGVTIAETRNGFRVLETAGAPVYCIPPQDVRSEFLTPTSKRTVCEWKGQASYYTVTVGDRVAVNGAWSYQRPAEGYEEIQGYFAFYAQKMDECYVGQDRVTPQPGVFYGGWITPNIVGPFKGDPGTEHW